MDYLSEKPDFRGFFVYPFLFPTFIPKHTTAILEFSVTMNILINAVNKNHILNLKNAFIFSVYFCINMNDGNSISVKKRLKKTMQVTQTLTLQEVSQPQRTTKWGGR